MKRTLWFLLALLVALMSWESAAWAQASVYMCVELTTGIDRCQHVSVANPLPVSGTFTPAGTSPEFTPVAPAAATATKGVLQGVQYNSTQATFTDGQQGAAQATARGAQIVAVGADGFAVTNAGTFAAQAAITAASGSFASGSQSIGITPTDRTVTSATGSSQTVMSASATRKSLNIVNTGNANCGINPTGGTAAIGGAGTLTLSPLGAYTPRIPTLSAVTAICTSGQPLYADES